MKKIGFCFLCQSDIHQLSLWENFFENNYDKCNIYIHSYEPQNITQDFVKKYHIDKNIPTGWGDIYDVVKYIMELSLINNDTKLILVSESTIPIKSFQYVYDYLVYDNKGFLCYTPHDSSNKNTLKMHKTRYELNSKKIKNFSKEISKKHWFYNETWIIFNQEMIQLILNDNQYIHYFKDCYVYDENYPIYLYSIKNKLDLFHNIKTTYTNWNTVTEKDGKRHPKTYDYLSFKLKHPNKLFARKFKKDCNITNDLLELHDLYKNKPTFIYDRCFDVLSNISKKIVFNDDTLFTYLCKSRYELIHIYQKVYGLIDKGITDQLNNKLRMGFLFNNSKP